MVNSFADHFWDADFNGTSGYDTLIHRLKDGKKTCDVFSDFIRTRAKLEDDYGKGLIRICQSTNEETGSLKVSLDTIKKETESIGLAHCELSKKLNDLMDRTMKFRETQKLERNKVDEKMRRLQKEKKSAYDNVFKVKRIYEQRCKEYEQCKEAYEMKSSYTPREEEKLKRNMLKAKTSVEGSDSNYQSTVKALDDSRKKWVLEMEEACEKFQSFEIDRIQFLRNEMWIYTNLGALQAIEIDERYEDCRKILERCDENADIQLFINQNHGGSERPAPILYENFYHQQQSTTKKNSDPKSLTLERNTAADPKIASLNRSAMLPRHPNKHVYSGPVPMSRTAYQEDDVTYSSINQLQNNPQRAQVVFEYLSQGEQEFTLHVGDVIEVIKIEDGQWAIGILNGKTGAFPLSFVDII